MAHYYYWPFSIGRLGDPAVAKTREHVKQKYQHGRPTANPRRTGYQDTVLKPAKEYTKQNSVSILCNNHKSANGEWSVYANKDCPPAEQLPLAKIKNGDVLFVDGHGSVSTLGPNTKTGPDNLSPKDLAYQLIKDGLLDGVIVKLLSCYGGGEWGSDANGDKIYAKQVAKSIGKRLPEKRSSVIVGGYPGVVYVGGGVTWTVEKVKEFYPARLKVMDDTGGQEAYGSELIRYYKVDGTLTKRPR